MGHLRTLAICLLGLRAAAPSVSADASSLFAPADLLLIDEIHCGDPADPHPLIESAGGVSQVENILGRQARVLPNAPGSRYFAYRIGAQKGLVAGRAYLLRIEYPEDQGRAFFVQNRGAEYSRGFHTGDTLGDSLVGYTPSNPESLRLPLSGEYTCWESLFYLHDRFAALDLPRDVGPRPDLPDDGFLVIIAQAGFETDPTSAGAAVARIALYEVLNPEAHHVSLRMPDGLPHRHLFSRAEMADLVIGGEQAGDRGLLTDTRWFENKAKVMRFLGMNTFTTTMLEFGHNQGFDPSAYGGNDWYHVHSNPNRLSDAFDMLAAYDFYVLPYYEYAGSLGANSLGIQKRCEPLSRSEYSGVWWSEKANCDVSDPEFEEDLRRLLEVTIVEHKQKVNFLGAWFRPRTSHLPISFSTATRTRFGNEANGGIVPSKAELESQSQLLNNYYDWWFEKRRTFLEKARDYLTSELGHPANILYTADAKEPGRHFENPKTVITDETIYWENILVEPHFQWWLTEDVDTVVASQQYLNLILGHLENNQYGEWTHAEPRADPEHYKNTDDISMTYTFNRSYTVRDEAPFTAFDCPGGMAMIRHYSLNENVLDPNLQNEGPTGYFVADVERAGPYCMMSEALAMAHGNPRYIGYLTGGDFQRGFPRYVRDFNAAFLSLPALPAETLNGLSSDPAIVVRRITTSTERTYYALINTSDTDKGAVEINLPDNTQILNAATGEVMPQQAGKLTLDFYPFRLFAIETQPDTVLTELQGWRQQHFGSDADDPAKEHTLWGDLADPDADGWVNLLEFALGSVPVDRLSIPLLSLSREGGNLKLSYRKDREGLLYQMEVFDTQSSLWSTQGIDQGGVDSLPAGSQVEAQLPFANPTLVHLRVTLP